MSRFNFFHYLKDHFGNDSYWKVPEILENMLQSDELYFDEVCQIHMDSWSNGRVVLIGDAAHAPGFSPEWEQVWRFKALHFWLKN